MRLGATLLDHAPDALTIFPVDKLAKVDSDMAQIGRGWTFKLHPLLPERRSWM